MSSGAIEKHTAAALFDLPCACQNLRRATRVVTRIYDQELRKGGLEITQFGLLTALAATGEANQKRLSEGFAMDSTTLTRTLALLLKQGWVRVRRGKDRRERLFRITQEGKRHMAEAQRYWDRAEQRLRTELGDEGWKSMRQTVSRITESALLA
jgi:DNA-binding MarR family transcriptional regulator